MMAGNDTKSTENFQMTGRWKSEGKDAARPSARLVLPSVLRLAVSLAMLLAFFPAAAQSGQNAAWINRGGGVFADFAERTSGEFAFYRDYTFNEPTWTGILIYDENTWAAQTYEPDSKRRVTVFFTGETRNGEFVLTGQRNEAAFRAEDVPYINYLMQIMPLLYNTRAGAAQSGAAVSAEASDGRNAARSPLPPRVTLASESPLFGGKCAMRFAPELPVFNLERVNDSSGKTLFEFEYGGRISPESDAGFFHFEPVPQEVRRRLAEIRTGRAAKTDLRGVQPVQVSPNFFLAGDSAFILTGSQQADSLTRGALAARNAKDTLLSPNATLIAIPGMRSVSESGDELVFTQIFYEKASDTFIRDMRVLRADSGEGDSGGTGSPGVCTFAIVSGFEEAFQNNEESLKQMAREILSGEAPGQNAQSE